MYEIKNNGKVFTSKYVGTGPSSYKKDLPGRGLTKVEKQWPTPNTFSTYSSLRQVRLAPTAA